MVYHDEPVRPLLQRAAKGMDSAWREIVQRYAPLVFAVCHRYGIGGADAQDVAGSVWLGLVAHLDRIREPEALPGWIATTAKNECLAQLRHRARQIPTDADQLDVSVAADFDATLIAAERDDVARAAFARLPERDQDLLSMLFADPPVSYKEISSTLGIPVGAIGPTRARCLTRARRTPAVAALAGAERRTARRTPKEPLATSHDLKREVEAA
ncbi:RNA polymerase sigma factor [Labedaea rhizosphaerae]|uniref:RNA polymerase sigma factor (Sigma-70 family) n=1 Tax=Labedaea rhizosphaerae TaxID=598644 RepID=A0A4R6RT37_LABRH|nr:sigma-70 family RNA polymerase sigma factor [Labedaea rhizosphaerae]TDP89914.1 RNA polymerase sigma factor (sigma-70 family) [Labedaea rhizosphaerae]